jgi:hypothetical protein
MPISAAVRLESRDVGAGKRLEKKIKRRMELRKGGRYDG